MRLGSAQQQLSLGLADPAAMARLAPLHVILLAQSLSAGSELLGQRVMLRCHGQSSVRMLISMSVYCSLQATVVLGAVELFLPASVSGGQGPFSMWTLLVRFPGLWLNAVVNGVYLLSITVLLREALGPLYVVFAFLSAAVLLGALGGGAHAAMTWGAALLGAVGAAFVLWPRDSSACAPRWTWRALRAAAFGESGDGAGTLVRPAVGAVDAEWRTHRVAGGGEGESDPLAAGGPETADAAALRLPEPDGTASAASAVVMSEANDAGAAQILSPTPPALVARVAAALAAGAALRHASVAAAFVTLALSAATGISLATHYQRVAGLNGCGYTAIDQVLLPLAALPLAAALDRSRRLRAWVGEPPWSPSQALSPSFAASLARTVGEVLSAPPPSSGGGAPDAGAAGGEPPAAGGGGRAGGRSLLPLFLPPGVLALARAPWPFLLTLAPYHGLEFARSFLLFFLVTTFDLDATYLQMTLVRVVLCWGATLLACTLLREWVGVPRADVERALSPVSLVSTCVGSALMVAAVALLRA